MQAIFQNTLDQNKIFGGQSINFLYKFYLPDNCPITIFSLSRIEIQNRFIFNHISFVFFVCLRFLFCFVFLFVCLFSGRALLPSFCYQNCKSKILLLGLFKFQVVSQKMEREIDSWCSHSLESKKKKKLSEKKKNYRW